MSVFFGSGFANHSEEGFSNEGLFSFVCFTKIFFINLLSDIFYKRYILGTLNWAIDILHLPIN